MEISLNFSFSTLCPPYLVYGKQKEIVERNISLCMRGGKALLRGIPCASSKSVDKVIPSYEDKDEPTKSKRVTVGNPDESY